MGAEIQPGGGPYIGPSCRCYEVGYEACPSQAHPVGWADRQHTRDSACDIVERSRETGIAIDPGQYGGYLRQALEARLLGEWYDANRQWDAGLGPRGDYGAGRAIHDPGDDDGRPTKPPPRHSAAYPAWVAEHGAQPGWRPPAPPGGLPGPQEAALGRERVGPEHLPAILARLGLPLEAGADPEPSGAGQGASEAATWASGGIPGDPGPPTFGREPRRGRLRRLVHREPPG